MKCIYCNRSVTDDNTGSLCAFHLDLEVLADFLVERGLPVTLAALCALIEMGAKKGGIFVVTPDDLAGLITSEFARKYEMAEGVGV